MLSQFRLRQVQYSAFTESTIWNMREMLPLKKALKIIGIVVGMVLLLLVGFTIFLFTAYPKVGPAPDLTVDATPERLARGKYLFNHVAVCVACHSERDYTRYDGSVVAGTHGMGGEPSTGPFGEVYALNITPHALKDWTDGELYRAISTGVRANGKTLFNIMPYEEYRRASKEDILSLVAYMRTLESIDHTPPKRKLKMPAPVFMRMSVQEAAHEPIPDKSDSAKYGEYLTRFAACSHCHTPMDKKRNRLPGMDFAGGFRMPIPGVGDVHTANITPDNETGIGTWTKDLFIKKFRTRVPGNAGAQTIMPWTEYSGMTDVDLGAIYDYLRTVKPVKNVVTKGLHPVKD